MKQFIKKWWTDFKTFGWKMYLALCLLALVPAVYHISLGGDSDTQACIAGSIAEAFMV